MSRATALVAGLLLAADNAAAAAPATQQDSLSHSTHMVAVEPDLQLEVLDWGGTGRPLVLLAGAGNSARVFDDFAIRLKEDFRVYGVSRRGFGGSGFRDSNYTAERLAEDLLRILESLNINDPIIVGHSIASEEMNAFARLYPRRASGLVYLDAAYDRTDPAGSAPLQQLGRSVPPPAPPGPADLVDFQSYKRWSVQNRGVDLPDAELRLCCDWGEEDKFIGFRARQTLGRLSSPPDYGSIQVPALAIFATPQSGRDIPGYRNQYDAEFQKAYSDRRPYAEQQMARFSAGVTHGKVVEIPGGNHYVFLSHPDDVVRELEAFVREAVEPFQRSQAHPAVDQ